MTRLRLVIRLWNYFDLPRHSFRCDISFLKNHFFRNSTFEKQQPKSTIFQIKTLVTAQPTGLIKTLQKLRMKLVSNELFIFSINLIRWKNKRPSGTMSAEFAYCFSIHRKSAPSIGSKWRPFGPPILFGP